MNAPKDAIEERVVAYLRDALAQRYEIESVRAYPGFDALSDRQIGALRTFGLRHIYPEWERRLFQDDVFDRLMALLSSPRRMKPLTAVALKSLWRFGRHFPMAIDAGKQVIDAFQATRDLESRIIDHLRKQQDAGESLSDINPAIQRALRDVPHADIEDFIESMTALMKLIAGKQLLDTGRSVLRDIARAMEKRPDVYEEREQAGLRYAIEIMEEGLAIFETLDSAGIEDAIQAVAQVESDWFDQVVKGT